jgi:hypothetical protein
MAGERHGMCEVALSVVGHCGLQDWHSVSLKVFRMLFAAAASAPEGVETRRRR